MDLRSLVVVLLSMTLASAGAMLPSLADAGTGSDAGDDPANATPISAGTYNGTLFPPGDADWYEVSTSSATEPVCARAVVGGLAHAEVTLSPTLGLHPAVTRPVEPGLILDLGLSTPSTPQFFLGLESPSDVPQEKTAAGSYTFDVRLLEIDDTGPGDGDTGDDAGDERATAVATEGPCIGGTLSDTSDTDVYAFDGIEGEHVALSLSQATSAPTLVNLTAPSGAQVEQIGTGDFVDVTVNETGEWLVEVDIPGQTTVTDMDYLVGLTVNGPEPQPCKPTCLFSRR